MLSTLRGCIRSFARALLVDPHPVAPVVRRISLVDRPKEDNGLEYPHDFHLKDDEVKRKLETLSDSARARWGDTLNCEGCHELDGRRQTLQADRNGSPLQRLSFPRLFCRGIFNRAFPSPRQTG